MSLNDQEGLGEIGLSDWTSCMQGRHARLGKPWHGSRSTLTTHEGEQAAGRSRQGKAGSSRHKGLAQRQTHTHILLFPVLILFLTKSQKAPPQEGKGRQGKCHSLKSFCKRKSKKCRCAKRKSAKLFRFLPPPFQTCIMNEYYFQKPDGWNNY